MQTIEVSTKPGHTGRVHGYSDRWNKTLNSLPYGVWTCASGLQILFNRRYVPMLQKFPDGSVHEIDPDSWINFTDERWFYKGRSNPASNPRVRKFCKGILAEWQSEML